MNKKNLQDMIKKAERREEFFNKKSLFDTLSYSEEIVGREKEAEKLVALLMGHKKGFAVPLVSVYGRSGSGKSTIVRFVCENLNGVYPCIVNLRKAKTIFGSANLILGELGEPNLKNAHGIHAAVSKIEEAILSKLASQRQNFLVLVLDEFDALFYGKKSNPSDFVYKLLTMAEHLKKKGILTTIICISNNSLLDYELDDRVRSRIGSSEIFFAPYSKENVIKILGDRIKKALADRVDRSVVGYCAELSSYGHGDARRAIDLLRTAAEIAAQKGEKISKLHIDTASNDIQNDRIVNVVSSASQHFRLACLCLARITHLTGESWHSTSAIYRQYCKLMPKNMKPLTYRRVSEILTEIENSGITVSKKASQGRYGYGTRYRLTVLPALLGVIVDKKTWKNITDNKLKHEEFMQNPIYRYRNPDPDSRWKKLELEEAWKKYVGI